jgi:hypothetical protein
VKFTKAFTPNGASCAIRFRPKPINPGVPDTPLQNNWYLDQVSIPGVDAPEVLEGPDVTIGDVLDSVQFNAADFSATYRAAARTWLNSIRSYAAGQALWKTALHGDAQINVTGAITSGIYPLKSTDETVYGFVAGDQLLNVTDNQPIYYRDLRELQALDPNLDEAQSQVWYWTDYGFNDAGEPLIGFHPRPSSPLTIKGPLYRQFRSLTAEDDTKLIDPFFGPVSAWSHAWIEGLRYYLEQNENEQGTEAQYRRWTGMVARRKMQQGISLAGSLRLRNLAPSRAFPPAVALADPGHYDNPEI